MRDPSCGIGSIVDASHASPVGRHDTRTTMQGRPWPRDRAEVAAAVKQRLSIAKQAYDNAINEALAELEATGEALTPGLVQEALSVSRASAYRYLQRRRRHGEAADA